MRDLERLARELRAANHAGETAQTHPAQRRRAPATMRGRNPSQVQAELIEAEPYRFGHQGVDWDDLLNKTAALGVPVSIVNDNGDIESIQPGKAIP
jgi:hypothetical protein